MKESFRCGAIVGNPGGREICKMIMWACNALWMVPGMGAWALERGKE